jgi:hypothetical protein
MHTDKTFGGTDVLNTNNIMNKFIGTKEVKARPLNLGAYNALRGWDMPKYENPDAEGYLVEYLDSPNKNHPDYDNYISWSPKDVFERSYKPSDTFLDRLILERDELQDRHSKLESFLANKGRAIEISGQNQFDLLNQQEGHMRYYLHTLNERINDLLPQTSL